MQSFHDFAGNLYSAFFRISIFYEEFPALLALVKESVFAVKKRDSPESFECI